MKRLSDIGPLRVATTIALALLLFAFIWLVVNGIYALR